MLVHKRRELLHSRAGGITVWCALTLIPGAALFLTILMVCRFHIEKTDADRITHLSGKAALTFYSEPLRDRYGLYGTAGSRIEERVSFFLNQNSSHTNTYLYRNPLFLLNPVTPFQGLFHYRVEKVSALPGRSLLDPTVFLQQVKEEMKYRVLGELVTFISDQMKTIQAAHRQNGGMEASYALIQQELIHYHQLYQRLNNNLFSSLFSMGVDGITDASADPEKITALLQRASEGETGCVSDLQKYFKWWRDHQWNLVNRNETASGICMEIGKSIQTIRQEIQRFEQFAAKLTEEERSTDLRKNMIKTITKIKNELWGMKGEAALLTEKLTQNVSLLKPLEEKLEPVLQQISLQSEIQSGDLFALKAVFSQLSGYCSDFDLEKASGQNGILDLLGITEWLGNYYVDLHRYAKDEALLQSDTEGFDSSDAFSLQQQISSQMESLDPGDSWEQRLEEKIFLVEYAICAFRNLSDTIAEEKGIWPTDLHGNPFGNTLLKNETEFLIQGSWNEFQNAGLIQVKIIALRTILNMAFLLTSSSKQVVLHEVADPVSLILPVVGGVLVYSAMVFLWSAAEAYLDYAALLQGGSVPLWKTEETWQSDLKGILKKASSSMRSLVKTENQDQSKLEKMLSMDYEMYLRILLLFVPEEQLISRMQTLIDLNLRRSGNPDFSLADLVVDYSLLTDIRGQYGIYSQQESFCFYPD